MTLLGTTKKGIDNDPNSHNGEYLLPNGKTYKMYHGDGKYSISDGDTILQEGSIDWHRFKDANIKKIARDILCQGTAELLEMDGVQEMVYEHIKGYERFKLEEDFNTEE